MKKNKWKQGVGLLFLMALFAFAANAGAATFATSLDRDTITLGESATLSLTFEGGPPQSMPSLPNIANLTVSDNNDFSQNIKMDMVSGQSSVVLTHTLTLIPQQTGKFVIPSLSAEVNGHLLTSQALTLTVLKPTVTSAAAGNPESQLAFMRLIAPKKKFFIGEVFQLEFDLFVNANVGNADDLAIRFSKVGMGLINVDGFRTLNSVAAPVRQVQIGNTPYIEASIITALSPSKTGTLTVNCTNANATLQLPVANSQRDQFFGFGMFRQFQNRQVSLSAAPLSIESLALITNDVPANFNGTVGNYTMNVTAGPTNIAVGDPVTVRVQISGRGDISALALPDQPEWRDLKVFPPTSHTDISDQLGIEGTKTFEQIVTPQNTDVHELPAFSFSFFNPETKTYQTLTQSPVPLAVHSGGASAVPTIAATKTATENLQTPQDILPIKQNLGALTQTTMPLISSPAFLALQSLPVLAWLAAFVWRKRADNLANNPRLQRQRRVAQIIENGLKDLQRFAAENNSDEFFATLFRLLQEQLGERLDCPSSAITESVVDERLASFAVADSLRELFQLCNQARYAPLRTSGELAAVIPQFENVIRELQNSKT
ncbi:MAG TPA: BatD family protein [Verrucomicrobiae bacterium]|nr:BatD family protein [Verrucomicrobiae bacterium]